MRRSTLIIFAVFIVLVAALLIWQRSGGPQSLEKATPSATPAGKVLDSQFSSMASIKVQDTASGKTYGVHRDQVNNWANDDPNGPPVTNGSVEQLVANLTALEVVSSFATPPPPDAVGTDKPAYLITLKSGLGAVLEIKVGSVTATGDDTFMQAGSKTMAVSKYTLQQIIDTLVNFNATPTPLPSTPTAPAATPEPSATPTSST